MSEMTQLDTDPGERAPNPSPPTPVKSDYFFSVGGGGRGQGGLGRQRWVHDLRELQGEPYLSTCPAWSHCIFEVC